MSSSSTGSISTCKYLFGMEAEEIYTHPKDRRSVSQKRQLAEECLKLMMRINVYLLSHKDGFFLVDPMAYNNQCHLYALRAALIKRTYHAKSEEEKLARTEENRFLHLSFFLNYALVSNTNLFVEAVKHATKEMGERKIRKSIAAFIRDEGKCREKAARIAMNSLFQDYIKSSLSELREESPLHSELFLLAHEDLHLAHDDFQMSSRGPIGGVFYTYPKFAGIAYFVDALAKENIAFAVKVKVITQDGVAGTIVQASARADQSDNKDPVIVFEAIATDGAYSVPFCREEAKRCPSYFYRNHDRNKVHKEGESCFFCRKTSIDLEPFRQRLQMAMQLPEKMFETLGADFILKVQHGFKKFFEDDEKYPHLSKLFRETIPAISALGLDMNNPTTFSVCHVHTDSASEALSDRMILDTPPDAFLEARGII